MTQTKRSSRKDKSQGEPAPKDGPLFMSVEHVERLGVPAQELTARLADADQVYKWIHGQATKPEWHSQDELVKKATHVWGKDEAVDRLNDAITLLTVTERIVRI